MATFVVYFDTKIHNKHSLAKVGVETGLVIGLAET